MHAALAHVAAGSGRVVMLVGEAGIGKTRTAAEFAVHARARAALALRGGCYEGEWAPPYGPFVEALTAYVRAADPPLLREELGFGAPPLARVLSAIRERLPDIPEPVALQPDEERFRLFDAVSQFLIAMANRRAVVLWLDDLHWADKGTIAMLRHVARFASQHRLLLLGSYRDVELEPQHPLTDALGALYRETTCERLALQGLDEHEVAQLIADSEAPPEMRETLAATISAATNGNPFFVREVLQHVIEESRLAHGPSDQPTAAAMQPISIPDSVRQVLARRVRRLSAETGALLTVGAAFGGSFHLPVAAAVASLDDATALNALDQALRAQLVRPADSAERYDFTHALIRETLYSELSPSRQARLHRQLAEAMEGLWGDRVAEHAAEIARHYHQSAALPGAERGVPYCVAVADQAERSAAFADAAANLGAALELLPASASERTRLLSRVGLTLSWALEFDQARRVAHDAAARIAAEDGPAAAADYVAAVVTALNDAGSHNYRGECALVLEGLEYAGERRDTTWAVLKALNICDRQVSDPTGPGIALDTPERRQVAAIFESSSEMLPSLALSFLTWTSRADVIARVGVAESHFALGEYSRGVGLYREQAVEDEQSGRITSAVRAWTNAARFHIALGEFAAVREARRQAGALAERLHEPSTATALLLAADDEWRLAMDEAQANNDVGRNTRLREELEFLIAELASAGRGRRAASHAERARSAVGKRIRGALKQIGAVDPVLGRYLRATVKIGAFCSYTPDPRLRVESRFEAAPGSQAL